MIYFVSSGFVRERAIALDPNELGDSQSLIVKSGMFASLQNLLLDQMAET